MLLFMCFATLAIAALQNVTVDDAVLIGPVIPQYLPSDSAWNVGNNCTSCDVQPDPSLAYNGTWHDTTYLPSDGDLPGIQLAFKGSALYIFFIIANTVPNATTFTDVYFMLDNVNVSSYSHAPDNTTDYQYNVPVYANDSMSFEPHNMTILPVDSGADVLMLFDYFIYSENSSVLSAGTQGKHSSKLNIGAIVGGTVGGVAFLVLVASLVTVYYRRLYRRGMSR